MTIEIKATKPYVPTVLFQTFLSVDKFLKVHMNRKFFLCRYKLSPLKYTISKFETFGVKIGDVTGVQSYTFFALKNGLQIARPKGQNVT